MGMRNKFLLGLVTISIGLNVLLLFGCTTTEASNSPKRYRIVEAGHEATDYFSSIKGELVVDTQTGVEYWYIEPRAGEGGSYSMTLLVDSEGKPVIWAGE